MGPEQFNSVRDLVIGAFASALIGGFTCSLRADRRNEVLHFQQILAELLVDEGGIGEAQETAVRVVLAQSDEIAFAYERFSSRVDVDVHTQIDALVDDVVNGLVAEVEVVPIFCRPTTSALQVAGARRIQKDRPGDIALMELAHFLLLRPRHEVAIDEEVLQKVIANFWIEVYDAHDELVPVVFRIDGGSERFSLGREQITRRYLVEHIHCLDDVLFGVL